MAATLSARPWPDPLRPGPAWAWQPPRPFPALTFRQQRLAATASHSQPAAPRAPTPPRFELELRVLLSRLQPSPDTAPLAGIQREAYRRAWSAWQALRAPAQWSAREPAKAGPADTLEDRRERLINALEQGLAFITTPTRMSRPARNHHLARQAAQIARRLDELARHPAAGALPRELQQALEALRQQR